MNDFYIDRLPSDCDYLCPPLFLVQPEGGRYCIGEHFQVVDNRWTKAEVQEILSSPLTPGYSNLFEITDIESNVDGSENWVCGFSVYFMKEYVYPGQEHRVQPETHAKLVDGVEVLVDYQERSPETVLRFHVSPEAWEAIAKRGLMGREHTQFYKMGHASEDSQVGTMWRMMVLDDSDYEYAIQTDVAPDEEWIFPRITDWGQREFLERLKPERFFLAGETYLDEYEEFKKELLPNIDFIRSSHGDGIRFPMLEVFNLLDHITCGGITTIPEKMPNLVPLFAKYLSMPGTLTVFDCETRRWTKIEQDDPLFYGWRGLGPDQNFWRFLKRTIPVRHIISDDWAGRLHGYPQDHYVFRMIRQYEKSGHEFVIDKTWQPLLEFLEVE